MTTFSRDLYYGARVRSVEVGDRPSFEGEVVYLTYGYVHNRDADGKDWHRTSAELSVIDES